MKHNSLADFTNKVTSKDLANITIIRITCITLFGKVTLFPFVSGSLPPFGKKPKGVRYRMQNRNNPRKYICLACGYLIPSCSLQKGR
jgi:hypothetical protein